MRLSIKPSKIYQFSLGAVEFKKVFEDIRKEREAEGVPSLDYSKILNVERLSHHLSSFIHFNENFLKGNLDSDLMPLTQRSNAKNLSPMKKTGTLNLRSKKSVHINAGRGTLSINAQIIKEKRESQHMDSPMKSGRLEEPQDSGRSRATSRMSVYNKGH